MPYYAGTTPAGLVESLNQSLDPSDAAARYADCQQITAPLSNPIKDENGYREMTAAEITAAALVVARAAALERTQFSRIEIRKAFKSMGIESTLNDLLSGNADFQTSWNESNIIDITIEPAVTALAALTAEQIATIKLTIAGLATE